ncbi:MAG: hypothetical protein WC455_22050 [Dehalococcoidia bacterium]|jgi:hypothetical protein
MDDTIVINGQEYVRRGAEKLVYSVEGLPYVIVRSTGAGCHAGYLKSKTDHAVELLNSRRLWYWDGAASLSQLAAEGVKAPQNCKFPCVVPSIEIAGWCEILPCTEKARQSISEVPVWQR